MSKDNILKYVIENSGQYFISDILYNQLMESKLYKSFGKTQYKQNKENNNYIDEVYKEFDIDIKKYESFVDVCSNPNQHTLYILNQQPRIKGQGISLAVNKRGYPPHPDINLFKNNYWVNYFDLLTDDIKNLKIPMSDYIIIDCFARHNLQVKEHNVKRFNLVLQLNALNIIVNFLKENGDSLYLLPFHYDIVFLLNILYALNKMFRRIKIFKSEINTPNLAIVYIYCVSYDSKFDKDILKKFRNNYVIFDKKYLQNQIKNVDYIYKKINIGHIKSIKQVDPSNKIPDLPEKIEYD